MKKKLEDLIPKENLEVYEHFLNMKLDDFDTNEISFLGFKLYRKIKKLMDKMKEQKLISEPESDFICVCLHDAVSRNFQKNQYLANKLFFHRIGPPTDWNLNLFIFLTVSDLKTFTGKQNYEAVADYFVRHEIYNKQDETHSAKTIADRFIDIKRAEIIQLIICLLYICEDDDEELIPQGLLQEYDDRGFLGPVRLNLNLEFLNKDLNPTK